MGAQIVGLDGDGLEVSGLNQGRRSVAEVLGKPTVAAVQRDHNHVVAPVARHTARRVAEVRAVVRRRLEAHARGTSQRLSAQNRGKLTPLFSACAMRYRLSFSRQARLK